MDSISTYVICWQSRTRICIFKIAPPPPLHLAGLAHSLGIQLKNLGTAKAQIWLENITSALIVFDIPEISFENYKFVKADCLFN